MGRPSSSAFRLRPIPGLLAGCLVAACVGPVCPTLGPDAIDHPAGQHDLVLRMQVGGGLLPVGMRVTELPQFSLYGDGTLLLKQASTGEAYWSVGAPPMLVGHLDEATVQELLRAAFDTACLATARDRYDNPQIFDAPTTVFTINAAGIEKVVYVYALSETIPSPDGAERLGFLHLAGILDGVRDRGDLGALTAYDPGEYRVTLLEGYGQPTGEPPAWPWADVSPADFTADADPHLPSALLTRALVARLMAVPNGGHPGMWVTAPDQSLVQLAVRPMLPEEASSD